MKIPTAGRWLVPLVAVVAAFAVGFAPPVRHASPRYLFSWTGDEDRAESDFMTVIDLSPASDAIGPRYGTVVATLPVGEKGLWPHHTEHELGASGMLFANGYAANRTFIFDLRQPLKPRVVRSFSDVGELAFLHSFERLASGHVIATFQARGPTNVSPGGIAELDDRGRTLRWNYATDPTADQGTLRPYSLAVVPTLDRIVVALTVMPIPTWSPLRQSIEHDHAGNQVQVYRLSDLALIKTIRLPTDDAPNEPRLLKDGRTVLVNTVACRLYRVTGLDGAAPALEVVHEEPGPGCGGPVLIGDYWVQSQSVEHRVYSLDVSDPAHVRTVASVELDAKQRPHWLASDGTRVVVVNEPAAQWERRIWMLTLDPTTGRLTLDSTFRDEGQARPGLAFDNRAWPHGASGTAVPHGTVFGR